MKVQLIDHAGAYFFIPRKMLFDDHPTYSP
jgi:hypothetical protein